MVHTPKVARGAVGDAGSDYSGADNTLINSHSTPIMITPDYTRTITSIVLLCLFRYGLLFSTPLFLSPLLTIAPLVLCDINSVP